MAVTPINPAVLKVDLTAITSDVMTLLEANSGRKEATIRNDTDYDIPYAEGYVPTANLYTDIIPKGGRLVMGRNPAAIIGYFSRAPIGQVMTTELV